MGKIRRFSFVRVTLVSLGLGFAIPAAFAAGNTSTAASPQPRPDSTVKVWTNDDLATLGPPFETAGQTNSTIPIAPSTAAHEVPDSNLDQGTPRILLNPAQDPQWYSQQLATLEAEVAVIASREEQLRNFRATGAGLPTGLNIAAPCEGVGTDNRISQLDARRREIEQQIDTLDDTARQNDMPPGILVEGRGRVTPSAPLKPGEQRALLLAAHDQLSEQLVETQYVVADMNAEAAAKGAVLLQPQPGYGGNLTTNLLEQLDNQANAIQSQISAVEDDARHLGVDPGSLR
jgi:prefoldin subunit 5